MVACWAVDADHLQAHQAVERLGVVDESLRLGQRHGRRLLGGPAANDRGFQSEDVAEILSLFPGAEHFSDMRDVVSAVEHRRDQPQPGQMGVVEERDPPDPQRWRQQTAIAVNTDVAGGGAGQPGQVVDPVFPGDCSTVWVADRRVEKLRHSVFDDLARVPPNALGRAPQVGQDTGDGAGLGSWRSVGSHRSGRLRRSPGSRQTGSPASVEGTGWRTRGTSQR